MGAARAVCVALAAAACTTIQAMPHDGPLPSPSPPARVPSSFSSDAILFAKDTQLPVTILFGKSGFINPTDTYYARRFTFDFGAGASGTTYEVALQSQQAGYNNFAFTATDGSTSCASGAYLPGRLSALADLSWISSDVVNTAANATVQLPGTSSRTVTCTKFTRESNTQQWLCASTKALGAPESLLIPLLHTLDDQALLFSTFQQVDPSQYPPSAPSFSLPPACTPKGGGGPPPSQWQVILGASVASFVAGIVLAITTVRCRAKKQDSSEKHAYQTALLDVM